MKRYYPTVYFYDIENNKELAKASGASIFLFAVNQSVEIHNSTLTDIYLYCDQNLAEYQRNPPEETELVNGVFKYLEPHLEQI